MIYLCRLFQDFIVLEDPIALPAISQTSSIIENKHLQFSEELVYVSRACVATGQKVQQY